jgi:hypothetical protein
MEAYMTESTGEHGPTPEGSDVGREMSHLREALAQALVFRYCDPIYAATGTAWADAYAAADVVLEVLGLERIGCSFCGMDDGGPCDDGQTHAYAYLIHVTTEEP